MSKTQLEQLKTKLEADRNETFQRKLADLLQEMEIAKSTDELVLSSLVTA